MSILARTRVIGLSISRHGKLYTPPIARRFISSPAQAYLETVGEGIASLVLNRPRAKNAISVQLLKEFRACIDTAAKDSA
jgi:methylglutaconyl-CoA hydratase